MLLEALEEVPVRLQVCLWLFELGGVRALLEDRELRVLYPLVQYSEFFGVTSSYLPHVTSGRVDLAELCCDIPVPDVPTGKTRWVPT